MRPGVPACSRTRAVAARGFLCGCAFVETVVRCCKSGSYPFVSLVSLVSSYFDFNLSNGFENLML
jgi:hypothetical protein